MIRNYTKEQLEWRDEILKPKEKFAKSKKEKPAYTHPAYELTGMEKTLYYMNNCWFWLNEYQEGRTTKEKALTAINSMREMCSEFERQLG